MRIFIASPAAMAMMDDTAHRNYVIPRVISSCVGRKQEETVADFFAWLKHRKQTYHYNYALYELPDSYGAPHQGMLKMVLTPFTEGVRSEWEVRISETIDANDKIRKQALRQLEKDDRSVRTYDETMAYFKEFYTPEYAYVTDDAGKVLHRNTKNIGYHYGQEVYHGYAGSYIWQAQGYSTWQAYLDAWIQHEVVRLFYDYDRKFAQKWKEGYSEPLFQLIGPWLISAIPHRDKQSPTPEFVDQAVKYLAEHFLQDESQDRQIMHSLLTGETVDAKTVPGYIREANRRKNDRRYQQEYQMSTEGHPDAE